MRPPLADRLTLELAWMEPPPAIVTAAGPAPPCGGLENLREAHLRLWQELVPLFTAGWCLAEPEGEAVHWHTRADGGGRLVHGGCTVQLERRPDERIADRRGEEAAGVAHGPRPAAPARPADRHWLVDAAHDGWTQIKVHGRPPDRAD